MLRLLVRTASCILLNLCYSTLFPYKWSPIDSLPFWMSTQNVNYNIDLLYSKTWMLSLMSSTWNGVNFKVFFFFLISKSVILLLSLSTILTSTLLVLTSGGKDDPSNYGTIALLPTSSKILEKAIHTQLNSYLNDNQFLTTNQ